MSRTALFPFGLLLAAILLLASPVHGCVNFQAEEIGNNNGLINFQLWDDRANPVCSLEGYPPYNLNCNNGLSASFDRDSGNVHYVTGHGTFDFPTDEHFPYWTSCQYDCGPGACHV